MLLCSYAFLFSARDVCSSEWLESKAGLDMLRHQHVPFLTLSESIPDTWAYLHLKGQCQAQEDNEFDSKKVIHK
jgi:hypothetical protein